MKKIRTSIKIIIGVVAFLIVGYCTYIGVVYAVVSSGAKQARDFANQLQWAIPPGTWDGGMSRCLSGLYIAGEDTNSTGEIQHIVALRGNLLRSVDVTYTAETKKSPLEPEEGFSFLSQPNCIFELYKNGQTSYWYSGIIEVDRSLISDIDALSIVAPRDNNLILTAIGSSTNGYDHYVYGFSNQQGLWVTKPQYREATNFWKGCAVVTMNDEDTVYITDQYNNKTRAASQRPISDVQICDGILRVNAYPYGSNETGYNYLRVLNNAMLSKTTFDDARDFSDGYAAVKQNGLWGYIDTNGNYVIEPQYSAAYDFSEGYACVVDIQGNAYFINVQNEQLSKPFKAGTWMGDYHDGLFAYQNTSSPFYYQLYDLNFKRKLPIEGVFSLHYQDGVWITGDRFISSEVYSNVGVYLPVCGKYIKGNNKSSGTGDPKIYNSVVVVSYNWKDRIYDKNTGKLLGKYDSIGAFSEGLAIVNQVTKVGLNAEIYKAGVIDISGKLIFDLQMNSFRDFSCGLSLVGLTTQERGFIPNPLLYSQWSADENTRAKTLGLTVTDTGQDITYDEMWTRIAELATLIHDKQEAFGVYDPNQFVVDVQKLRSNLEATGFPTEGTVDRQHLAMALTELSRSYGLPVDCYIAFYKDNDAIAKDCYPAVAYLSSLNIFEMEDQCVQPEKAVTDSEVSTYLLRYFENTLK